MASSLTSPMRVARLRAQKSTSEAASATGRCVATIERYELGRHTPPQHVMVALARFYGCPVEALVG